MGCLFTVDLEEYWDALPEDEFDGTDHFLSNTLYLFDTLGKYKVKAIVYVLGRIAKNHSDLIKYLYLDNHMIGSHGYFHEHAERQGDKSDLLARKYLPKSASFHYRSPYWDTTPMPRPPAGGFFFRIMPYQYTRWAVLKSNQFWIHPHDIDIAHPKLKNKLLDWKRHIGLDSSRNKLERLLKDIKWDNPCQSANQLQKS